MMTQNYKGWTYNGDISIREGGYYWKEDNSSDYVLAVDVAPYHADNLFLVRSGTIYISDDQKRNADALACIGMTTDGASRADIVDASRAYGGLEFDGYDGQTIVRVGTDQTEGDVMPDVVLRSNASLRKYIKRTYLG